MPRRSLDLRGFCPPEAESRLNTTKRLIKDLFFFLFFNPEEKQTRVKRGAGPAAGRRPVPPARTGRPQPGGLGLPLRRARSCSHRFLQRRRVDDASDLRFSSKKFRGETLSKALEPSSQSRGGVCAGVGVPQRLRFPPPAPAVSLSRRTRSHTFDLDKS